MMPLQTVGSLGERKEEGFAQKLGLFIPRSPPDLLNTTKIVDTVAAALRRVLTSHQHGPGTIRLGRIWQMDGVCQSVLRTSLSSSSHNKAGPKTKF
jgi:hypothetical protein